MRGTRTKKRRGPDRARKTDVAIMLRFNLADVRIRRRRTVLVLAQILCCHNDLVIVWQHPQKPPQTHRKHQQTQKASTRDVVCVHTGSILDVRLIPVKERIGMQVRSCRF